MFQRARSPEAKTARRQAILQSTETLLLTQGFEQITLEEVGKQAGLSKATIYLYFPTREALFLSVLQEALDRWMTGLQTELRALPPHKNPRRMVAETIAHSIANAPILLSLLPLMHQLEPHVPIEHLITFKRFLVDNAGRATETIEQLLHLEPGRGLVLLRRLHALTIGLVQTTPPSAEVLAALGAHPALLAFSTPFEQELADCLEDWFG